MTFLWRAAGCPAVEDASNAFEDLAEGAYYLQAVKWAVANGITTGVTTTEFAPDRTVTRGEAVTFLWRWKGMPSAQGEGVAFDDVPEEQFFAEPVTWAEQNSVTTGIGPGLFGPYIPCTRAQIVTFLYRAAD